MNVSYRRTRSTAFATIVLVTAATVGTATAALAEDRFPDVAPGLERLGGRITFGLGLGALYGGIGANIGWADNTRLVYGSIGCIGASSFSSSGSGVVENEDASGTNCGFGFGALSTTFLPGDRQGLGLNLGLTYDSVGIGDDELRWHVRPTYNYFFGGTDARGFNLGFSPVLTFGESDTDPGLWLNVGYQF